MHSIGSRDKQSISSTSRFNGDLDDLLLLEAKCLGHPSYRGTLEKSIPETKMWLNREFFADTRQATMQERRLHCRNVVAMSRATSGDCVLPCLSLQYMLQF